MHPQDLALLAAKEGRLIWSAAADESEYIGEPWEISAGYRLLASLGCHTATSREHGVEVWRGVTVYSQRWGGILVRLWDGKAYRSGRTEWVYSTATRRWDQWRMSEPDNYCSHSWRSSGTEVPQEVREAVEAATAFRR